MFRDCAPTATRVFATGTMRRSRAAGVCALGVITALLMAAPSAVADPVDPPPPPPVSDTAPLAVSGDPAVPPAGVPHLPSPDNLPPGTTTDAAVGRSQTPRLFRLRELWDAIHSDGMSLSEALPLLAQRPLDANAVPPPGVSAGPQPPATEALPPTP